MEVTGSLATKTAAAIETASESLELLEVSADLSVNLITAVADSAQEEYEALCKLFPEELSQEQLQQILSVDDRPEEAKFEDPQFEGSE